MKTPRILALTIASLLTPTLLHAQTWDGEGSAVLNLNWSHAQNWNPNFAPVNDGTANIVFAGTTGVTPNLDQAWSVNSVTFNNGASPFRLGSTGGFTLSVGSGGIVNNDDSLQDIDHPVSFSAATATINAIRPLIFRRSVDLGTNAVTVTGSGGTYFVNFSGTGSVSHTGAGVMDWAPTTTTSADIIVTDGVLRTVQDGSTDVFDGNASIAVNGTGGLLILENMTLDGGAQMTRQAGAYIYLNPGNTLTVQGGSDAVFTGDIDFSGTTIVVNGTGSTMQTLAGGNLSMLFSSALSVQSGASVSVAGGLDLGSNGGNGQLTVDGTGSAVSVGALSVFGGGGSSIVTLSNAAVGNFAAIEIAEGAQGPNVTTVLSGADVITTGNLRLATFTPGGTGTLTVSGTGSTWTQTGVGSNTIGGAVGGAAVLNVQDGGTFTTGTGSVMLNATATINIDGGTLNLRGPLIRNGGVINFTSGSLGIVDNFTVGAGGLLGTSVTLDGTRRFTTSATTTIDAFRTLTLNGGTFSTGALVNNGTLAFTSGTLAITGAGGFNIGTGALGANVTLGTGKTLQVTNTTTVASGASLIMGGGATSGGALANSGLITGEGTIGMALANGSGGQVRAEAGGRLIFTGAAANNGSGSLQVSAGGDLQFTNTLANNAAIDVIGGTFRVEGAATNAASTGRITGRDAILRFNGGLTNSGSLAFSFGTSDVFGDLVNAAATGRIVVSGNSNVTFYDDLVNSGTVQVSTGSTAVYFGAVSGAGSFPGGGTNFFEGDLAPGASPALVTFGGNVVYGTFLTNEMELGGTVRGTGYDAVNVAGNLTLNGTLNVLLIGGFQPQSGHVFNLFDWGTKTGTFSTVNLPALNPGLLWSKANLYTSGEIQVALDTAFTGRIWDGGGGDNAWATDTNWDLNVEPLNNGNAQLVFAGNVRLTPSVDTAWNVASITFDNTAGAFTITGPQGVTVGAGGITNNDADTQTITAALTLSASATFSAAAGDLEVGSVDIGTQTLTLAGANDLILGGATGTGTVEKSGAGTLDITGPLGTGGVAVNATSGTTRFHSSQTLASLTIGAGATVVFTSGPPPAPFAGVAGVVPEPASAALLLTGTALLLGRRRRPRHASPTLNHPTTYE